MNRLQRISMFLSQIAFVLTGSSCAMLPLNSDSTIEDESIVSPEKESLTKEEDTVATPASTNERDRTVLQYVETKASAEYHFSMAQAYSASGDYDKAIEEYKLTLFYDPDSALVYSRLAAEYVKRGMLSAAMEASKEALKRDPHFADARLMLAGLLAMADDANAAIAEYDKILAQDPTHEEAAIYKSQTLIDEDRAEEAGRLLIKFIARSPESTLAWYTLGRVAQKHKDYLEAARCYKKALSLRPGFSQAAFSLGFLYEIMEKNEEAIKVYYELFEEGQDMAAANRLATIYLKEQKYDEAIRYLDAIRAADPEDMNVLVKLGLVQLELKLYAQAVETFLSILTKHSDSERIRYYLGSVYEEMKEYSLAIDQLKLIEPESKLYEDATLHVTYLLKQLGKSDEAKSYIIEATQRKKRTPEFYIFHASLEEDEKDLSSAIAILEGGVEMVPDDEKLRYYLGSLYDRKGELEKSLRQMEQILSVNPENVDALNYIGYTWTVQGIHLDDAEKMIRKAMKLKPDSGYVQDSWGWFLFTKGKMREAVVQLEKAVQLKPNEPTILEHLADAYFRSNLIEKALATYQAAMKHSEDESSQRKLAGKIDTLMTEISKRVQGDTPVDRVPASE